MWVKPPPSSPPAPPTATGDCTRTVGGPIGDTIFAGGLFGASAYVAANAPDDESSIIDLFGAVLLTAAGVGYTMSAVHGYVTTAECRHRYDLEEAERTRPYAPAR